MTADIKPQTEMTNAPTKQVRMVKIKTVHPIRLGEGKDETVITENSVVSVTEEQAKEFCDRKYPIGHKGGRGGSLGNVEQTLAVRAVRVG